MAAWRRGVPSGSGALLLGLCPGMVTRGETRGYDHANASSQPISESRFGVSWVRRSCAAPRQRRLRTRRKRRRLPRRAREATPFERSRGHGPAPRAEHPGRRHRGDAAQRRGAQDLNITTATDIVKAVPGLKMNAYSSAQVVFNIRGVSQNDYGDQQEPPVAVYQDDSYSSSINLASFPVFDLARVETLRGPQGTLFGRNATGGAIQFISRQADRGVRGLHQPDGRQLQPGHPGRRRSPARSAKASRADSHSSSTRTTAGWSPSCRACPTAAATITMRCAARSPGSRATRPTCRPDRPLPESGRRDAGRASIRTNRPARTRRTRASSRRRTSPARSGARGRARPAPASATTSIIPSRGGDPWKTAETEPSFVDREIFGAQVRVDHDFGGATLTSITDYQTSDKFYTEGGDASPDDGVYFFQGSDLDQISQEFRLSWSAGAHEIVAGLFGMDVDGDYIGKFADPFYGYDPDVAFSQETTSYAAFFQDEWSFSERWKLIGGLRYWHDTREGAYFGVGAGSSGPAPYRSRSSSTRTRSSRTLRTRRSARHARRRRRDVRRLHCARGARLPAERRPALVLVATTAAARAAASRSRPARRTARNRGRLPERHSLRSRDAECLRDRHEVEPRRRHDDAERQRLLLRLRGLPGFRAARPGADRDQPGCGCAGTRSGAERCARRTG